MLACFQSLAGLFVNKFKINNEAYTAKTQLRKKPAGHKGNRILQIAIKGKLT
jgi:hypothetical protein